MDIGQALYFARTGSRIARKGWNGKKMFIYLVEGGSAPAKSEAIKGVFHNDMVPYREYWAMKTAQHDVTTWSPSGTDSLAKDWEIVD